MKHLIFDFLEATEAAALAVSKHIGSGDKKLIDKVASDAMRDKLNQVSFSGRIVIGEGLKDGSYGLFKGEKVGLCRGITDLKSSLVDESRKCDIAVDPVDGTTQTSVGGYEAMSVLAAGSSGSLFQTEHFYMHKLAVGRQVAEVFHPNITTPIEETIKTICDILGKNQITVCVLDRTRHEGLIKRLRDCGCLIKLIQDCDVSGAIAAAMPNSGVDMYVGTGGSPEGVLAAAAIKCLGGYFEGYLVDNKTFKPIDDQIHNQFSLCKSDVMFSATGILDGSLLNGVKASGKEYRTHSLLLESATKSLKWVESHYYLE